MLIEIQAVVDRLKTFVGYADREDISELRAQFFISVEENRVESEKLLQKLRDADREGGFSYE